MKEFIAKELGCKYRWNEEYNSLEWAAAMQDGTYDEWGAVDEDIVGEEIVTFRGREMTLSEVYRMVEWVLGVKSGG